MVYPQTPGLRSLESMVKMVVVNFCRGMGEGKVRNKRATGGAEVHIAKDPVAQKLSIVIRSWSGIDSAEAREERSWDELGDDVVDTRKVEGAGFVGEESTLGED